MLRRVGPARARCARAADHDVARQRRRSRTSPRRPITVGAVPTVALRVTYVGELGWELYCPTEYGAALWDVALGGRRTRTGCARRRLPRDRRAARREGLPRVVRRHHARGQSVRGRARLRGRARQADARSSARTRCARSRPRASTRRLRCVRLARPARGPARLGAGAHRRRDRRPGHERRLRLPGRAPPSRSRTSRPTGPSSVSAVEIEMFGDVAARARSCATRSGIPRATGSAPEPYCVPSPHPRSRSWPGI